MTEALSIATLVAVLILWWDDFGPALIYLVRLAISIALGLAIGCAVVLVIYALGIYLPW